jgi:vancomycin permeability regulator SanA
MKKVRGDKSFGVMIHIIYTQKYHKETLFVATFISNKQKSHFFSSVFLFSYKKLENRRMEKVL